ncbi:GNAT family N-acetyltransferase [uncultured Adlercreutzia sp.]|uniref:GNAT family N-acetyltransferase n=1 Tax=uncultured Adlercreutzia sp. TaxID=875803 RepID=UPI0025EB2528|nr:GNAT family N-acetyltransferase [uncultured Adlercreutzia sp.]MCI9262495.1 GNAT family N-acetyltransferase [Eggerthellaceae bacterium]
MDIIVARPEHVEAMTAITDRAKANMAAMGIDQWQAGYPDRATWEADVAEGMAYVGLEGGRVVAVFRYSNAPEAAYDTLEGEWLTAGPYATIHRCAVDPDERGRGLIAELFQFACDKAAAEGMTSMRIDTHADNAPMGRAVEKFGFTYCGAITLTEGPEAGGARIAFEKVL